MQATIQSSNCWYCRNGTLYGTSLQQVVVFFDLGRLTSDVLSQLITHDTIINFPLFRVFCLSRDRQTYRQTDGRTDRRNVSCNAAF